MFKTLGAASLVTEAFLKGPLPRIPEYIKIPNPQFEAMKSRLSNMFYWQTRGYPATPDGQLMFPQNRIERFTGDITIEELSTATNATQLRMNQLLSTYPDRGEDPVVTAALDKSWRRCALGVLGSTALGVGSVGGLAHTLLVDSYSKAATPPPIIDKEIGLGVGAAVCFGVTAILLRRLFNISNIEQGRIDASQQITLEENNLELLSRARRMIPHQMTEQERELYHTKIGALTHK